MTEVFFYHLGRQGLAAVLPRLLQMSLDRGWRALVKCPTPERLGVVDDALWTFADESFLPHGPDGDGAAADHPVLLTTGDANGNGAQILFVTDGAALPADLSGYARVALILDGGDEDAVRDARVAWRSLAAAGHAVSYWRQSDGGRWEKAG